MRNLSLVITFVGAIIGGVISQPALGYIRGAFAQTLNNPPAASYCFPGVDTTTQYCVGYLAGAAEYISAIGGLTGQGGSLLAQGAATNVSMNITMKGSGGLSVNDGSGPVFQAVGPAFLVNNDGALQATPSPSASSIGTKVGNSHYGVQLDCGTNNRCQPMASMTPSSSSQACAAGDMSWDTGFIYVCTASNTWCYSGLVLKL